MIEADGGREASWLVEVVRADSARAIELVRRDARMMHQEARVRPRLIAGLRCPSCGRSIVVLVAPGHATGEIAAYLESAAGCLHPPAASSTPGGDR